MSAVPTLGENNDRCIILSDEAIICVAVYFSIKENKKKLNDPGRRKGVVNLVIQ